MYNRPSADIDIMPVNTSYEQREIHCNTLANPHINTIHHIVPVYMSLGNTHKLIHGILYGGFNTRRYTSVHDFYFFKLFPVGCIGLNTWMHTSQNIAWRYLYTLQHPYELRMPISLHEGFNARCYCLVYRVCFFNSLGPIADIFVMVSSY